MSEYSIGSKDSKRFKCCNHPDRPARLPSHVLCAECFAGLDKKMHALAAVVGKRQCTGGITRAMCWHPDGQGHAGRHVLGVPEGPSPWK